MLTQDALREFKDIYQSEYGVVLSDEEATRKATDFLNLMQVLVKPDVDIAKGDVGK